MKKEEISKNSPRTNDTRKLALGKHLNYIRNSSILSNSKDSIGSYDQSFREGLMKENLLEGEDCASKFEQTMFLEDSSKKTWKKKNYSYHTSQLVSKEFQFMEKSSTFQDKAIQLIRVKKNGDFEVTSQGIRFLESVEGPLVALGVAGMYRTGKSYLLNKVILRSENGFGVAPTINACTKGIWIYGKPFNVKLSDGRFANLIVMDSEGLGALDQDSGHDCRIFALILLLSSMFLYNSVGAIDENAISSLSLVINLTKHIKVRGRKTNESDSEDEVDPEELSKFFPSFLWILRDFSLELVNELGDEISAKEYLENSLALHKGISEEVERKNRLRRMIKQFFSNRDCFPLVRPLVNEGKLIFSNIQTTL